MNHSKQQWFCLVLVGLTFLGLNCTFIDDGDDGDDGEFEVHLRKDKKWSYYLEWTEPLKEERIVLIRISGLNVWHDDGTDGKNFEETQGQVFVRFPVGSVRSRTFDAGRLGTGETYLLSVEILPAFERFYVELPIKVFDAGAKGIHDAQFFTDTDNLFGHLSQPYDVDYPSKLNFVALTVTVDPPPGSTVPLNQDVTFRLKFDYPVTEASFHGLPAAGSLTDWFVVLHFWLLNKSDLLFEWTNFDGSTDSARVGPYTGK